MNNLLKWCLKTPTESMLSGLTEMLESMRYQVELAPLWAYAPGDVPILLVAHVDTVHAGMPREIFHDEKQGVVWSPDGLGADDRAGVYGILRLLQSGLRPHVLFTDEEEIGGRGAESAARELAAPEVNLMVQLDRKGSRDAVWYDCAHKKACKWVNKHGFATAEGSFTDISVLMPAWGIAGVNLSVGYYNQHTEAEYLVLPELEATVQKVACMIQQPPASRFAFRQRKYRRLSNWSDQLKGMVGRGWPDRLIREPDTLALDMDESPKCALCDLPFALEDLYAKDGQGFCVDCLSFVQEDRLY